jgi:hypothetical protein
MSEHARIRDLAATALDFELDPDERAELDAHLATCPACAADAEALRGDLAFVRALPAPGAPVRVRQAVLGDGPAVGRRWSRFAPALAVLAFTVLPIGIGVVLLRDLQLGLGIGAGSATPPPGGGWVLIAGGPGAQPSGGPGATVGPTVAPATAAPTPPASVDPSAAPTLPPAGEIQGLDAVAWSSIYGFIAVGDACPAGSPCGAAVVRSASGEAWFRVRAPAFDLEPLDQGTRAGMRDVTFLGRTIVAVGAGGDTGQAHAMFWSSDDGDTWDRAPSDDTTSGWADAVATVGSDGVVAVGGDDSTGMGRAAVWVSADGRSWRRIRDSPALDIGGRGPARDGRRIGGMADVIWDGRQLVAIGAVCDGSEGPCRGAAWTSTEGATWRRHDDAFGFGIPSAIASVGDLLVVVGRDADLPAAWTSSDGITWRRVEIDATAPAELRDIARIGLGAVAVGVAPAEPRVGVAWSTDDGREWRETLRGGAFAGASVDGVAVGDDVEDLVTGDRLMIAVGRGRPGQLGLIWRFEPAEVSP